MYIEEQMMILKDQVTFKKVVDNISDNTINVEFLNNTKINKKANIRSDKEAHQTMKVIHLCKEIDKRYMKKLNIGETVYLPNKDSVKTYSLTINNVKFIKERNKYSEKKADKVVEIEYTYENISMDEELFIYDHNFKIYDADENRLETYPIAGHKFPQLISKGNKCTATMVFALNHNIDSIEAKFYFNPYNYKVNSIFSLDIK